MRDDTMGGLIAFAIATPVVVICCGGGGILMAGILVGLGGWLTGFGGIATMVAALAAMVLLRGYRRRRARRTAR
ncbi:MAG: hypothetical protein PF443_00935, partial [Allgaiera sp.]|nr:hypothetical protein [Allgaiera sp.]